jgi:hypothetical protein
MHSVKTHIEEAIESDIGFFSDSEYSNIYRGAP